MLYKERIINFVKKINNYPLGPAVYSVSSILPFDGFLDPNLPRTTLLRDPFAE